MNNEIIVTRLDYTRLNSMILNLLDDRKSDIRELNFLNIEIKNAKIIEPKKVSPDYVTMNSVIEVRFSDTAEAKSLRLVYPKEANINAGNISVLSPLGCALLGNKTSQTISFKAPSGLKTVTIDKIIYQPEANGEDL